MDIKKVGLILGFAAGIIIGLLPPPAGLTPAAMRGIGIIIGTILLFVFESLPNYAATTLMCACFVIFKVGNYAQAFSAYAGSIWWLVVGVLGIGIAVNNCGLLKRLSFYAMRLFPPTYSGMIMALLGVGTAFAPLMPTTMAKQAIAAPVTMKIGENLGLKKRSKGMAGLFNAMYIGWSINGTIFVSASFVGYMMIGALPESARNDVSWIDWFIAMIPWGTILIVCTYFMLNFLYKPKDSQRVSKDLIDGQLKALGPVSRNEKLVGAVFLVTLAFWITEGMHHIPSTGVALVALIVLAYLNLFTVQDFQTKMPWSLIFYIGGVVNIGSIISAQKIDVWFGNLAGPTLGSIAVMPYAYVVLVALSVYLMRFIMISFSSLMVIVTIILSPIAWKFGIHPWVTGMIAYCSSCTWVTLYQNANMLVGWAASGGEEYLDFKHVRLGACGYLIINIIGLLASIVWWKSLGYIQ